MKVGGISEAAVEPLSRIAEALCIVRGYWLDPCRSADQDEFMSVAMDDYERMLVEHLSCAAAPDDDDACARFLAGHGLDYLVEDMREYMRRVRRETELCGFFPEDSPI